MPRSASLDVVTDLPTGIPTAVNTAAAARAIGPDAEPGATPRPRSRATFTPAGHILGAASLLLEVAGHRILFSGDLGRPDDLLMTPPADPPAADTVLIESTYGDRLHPPEDLVAELAAALARLAARGGVAVVPVFAVGRAQALLHAIAQLKSKGAIPRGLPVFLDSPMAVHTTNLFTQHPDDHRLSARQAQAMAHAGRLTRFGA